MSIVRSSVESSCVSLVSPRICWPRRRRSARCGLRCMRWCECYGAGGGLKLHCAPLLSSICKRGGGERRLTLAPLIASSAMPAIPSPLASRLSACLPPIIPTRETSRQPKQAASGQTHATCPSALASRAHMPIVAVPPTNNTKAFVQLALAPVAFAPASASRVSMGACQRASRHWRREFCGAKPRRKQTCLLPKQPAFASKNSCFQTLFLTWPRESPAIAWAQAGATADVVSVRLGR